MCRQECTMRTMVEMSQLFSTPDLLYGTMEFRLFCLFLIGVKLTANERTVPGRAPCTERDDEHAHTVQINTNVSTAIICALHIDALLYEPIWTLCIYCNFTV